MTRRRRALADLERDIRDHLECETQENMERGMSPADARAAALRKFGSVGLIEEQTRAVWRRPWIDQLRHDLLFSLRILRRAPGFTTIAVLTLAVGIGLNTAVFSVVNSVLLRPLEYPHSERLVWLGEYDPALHRDMVMLTDAAAWRTNARSYNGVACYSFQQAAIATHRDAFPVAAVFAGGDFWSLTGATPALGRLFGSGEQNGVVISWDLFQRQFGGDSHAVGSAVTVDGAAATITGVLPRTFRFQFPRWWTALHPEPIEAYFTIPPAEAQHRGGQVVASLKPGVSIPQAFAELQSLRRSLHPPDPSQPASRTTLHVDVLRNQLTSGARRALLVLLAAGALLLLMVSVNIASLLLARTASRRRELAIRLAIGAGRFRALRQLLVESLTLAFLGGSGGLLLARWTILLLARFGPASIPRLDEASIDLSVLAFAFSITLAAGILFGIAPGFALWRTDLHDALKEGARFTGALFGLRIRRVLVAGELALALMLLTGAGLLLASFLRMNARPAAFTPEKILVMKARLPVSRYSPAMQQHYRDELLRRLGAIPGIESAGISFQPMFCCAPAFPNDSNPNQTHLLHLNFTTPGYLRALGIELRKGRWLTNSDKGGVILLNESMAREAFGPADPIGRTLKIPQPEVVVGLIGDLHYTKLDADVVPEIFVPLDQQSAAGAMMLQFDIAVRAPILAGIPAAVRYEMAAIDSSLPPYDVKTLRDELADSISSQRFDLFLLGSFALAAFVLALVGIYGAVTYSVAARTREIGVRVALGAQRGNVIGMVVREGMMLGLVGIVIGLAASCALTRLMTSLLYGVKATDPRIFAASSAALGLTALFASWLPARNAASIEPVVALRDE
jgi:putative ABC transport system permease protein